MTAEQHITQTTSAANTEYSLSIPAGHATKARLINNSNSVISWSPKPNASANHNTIGPKTSLIIDIPTGGSTIFWQSGKIGDTLGIVLI